MTTANLSTGLLMSERWAELRARLENLLAELTELDAVSRESAQVVELDQTRVGRLSRMDAMQAQAMSIESNRRRALEIRRIQAALQRIADGEYGECRRCGEAINPKRLAVDPAAPLCIDCANHAD